MKLKWYDWDGVGLRPSNVKGIKYRGDPDFECVGEKLVWDHDDLWGHSGDEYDITAYTLGEPLEPVWTDEKRAELSNVLNSLREEELKLERGE